MNGLNISSRMTLTWRANDFTSEMFSVQGIEVLGTPLGTDVDIRDFVAQNCIKITKDVEKINL